MGLQTLLMALALWASNVLADCITIHRNSGVSNIVAYRLFNNQSLAIYDSRNHFVVYDSSGSIFYNETIALPLDPVRNDKPFYPYVAVIGNNSELYIATIKNETFRYSSGKIDETGYYANNRNFGFAFSCFTFRGLPDTPLMVFRNVVFMWGVNSSSILDISDENTGHSAYTNFSYIQKTSANPILNEYSIVTRNNMVYVAKANYIGNWKFSPSRIQPAVTYQDSSFLMIITNFATSTSYFAYCAFQTRDGSGRYPNRLVVRSRSNWSFYADVVIEEFYAYSIALHPTEQKVYILSSLGDLYEATFQVSMIFTVSTPVLKISGVSNKNADLEVISLTKLVIRTPGSIIIVDISTSNPIVAIQTSPKPTFSRAIPRSNNIFVVYANRMITLVDTETLSSSTLFSVSGTVREIVVNTDSSKPRFYVLHSNKLEVYSLTNWTLVCSKTTSELETVLSTIIGGIFHITGLLDIDVLRFNTGYIVLTVFGNILSSKDTYISILAEDSLTFVASKASGISAHFNQVMTHSTSGTNFDYIMLLMPDTSWKCTFTYPSTLSAVSGWVDLHLNPGNGDAISLAKKMVKMTMSKGTARDDFEIGKWVFPLPDQYGFLRVKYQSSSWAPFDINTYNPWRRGNSIEYLKGIASNKMGNIRDDCLDLVSSDSKSSNYCSDYLSEAIGIQRGTDDRLYFYSNDQSLASIRPDTCFGNGNLLSYFETGSASCDVANCMGCSILDYNLCGLCNTGYYLSADRRSCINGCTFYVYQGFCKTVCPIETYHAAGTPNQCLSKSECIAANLLILGDWCGKVSSCPSGSTLNSGVCVPNTGRAANINSLLTVTIPCSGVGQVYWIHYQKCVVTTGLPTSNYTIISGSAYCDGGTHFYNPSTKICIQICSGIEGISNTLGRFCVASQADCLGLSYFVDELTSPTPQCTPSCYNNLIDTLNNHCISRSACMISGRRVLDSNLSCISICPISEPYLRNQNCLADCPSSTFLEESIDTCVDACKEATSGIFCLRLLDLRINSAIVSENEQKATLIVELFFKSNPQDLVRNLSIPLKNLFQNIVLSPSQAKASVDSVSFVETSITIEISSEHVTPSLSVTLITSSEDLYANGIRSRLDQSAYSKSLTSSNALPETPFILELLARIAVVASASLTVVKVASPFMMSLGLDASTGNVLCLIAQTYTKLVMMTHFEFWLPQSSYSQMYYRIFREFLDNLNEQILLFFVGPKMVNINKEVVCEAGYEKFCMLTVEDSFFLAHLLALFIFAAQAMGLYVASILFGMLGKNKIGDLFKRRLKSILPFAFLLESSLEFWFTMTLSITIPYYKSPELSLIKSFGHVVLIFFIVNFAMIIWKFNKIDMRNEVLPLEGKSYKITDRVILKTASQTICSGIRDIITEVANKKSSSNFVRVFLFHDVLLALLLVFGSHAPKVQSFIWATIEIVLVFLIIKFDAFKSKSLFWRQLILELLFVVLALSMGISCITWGGSLMPTYIILGVSMTILLTDIGYTGWIFSADLLKILKKSKSKNGSTRKTYNFYDQKQPSLLIHSDTKRSKLKSGLTLRGNPIMMQELMRHDSISLRAKPMDKLEKLNNISSRSISLSESPNQFVQEGKRSKIKATHVIEQKPVMKLRPSRFSNRTIQ